ncbi:MAG: protein translocase subunit SecF [Candidatus Woesearchaeota archaeon]
MAKSHRKKRLDAKLKKKKGRVKKTAGTHHAAEHSSHSTTSQKQGFYEKYYKQLLIIPFLLLVAALLAIGAQYAATGDFLNKGIKLKGGTAVTITDDLADISSIDVDSIEELLLQEFPDADIVTRTQKQLTTPVAINVEIDLIEEADIERFKDVLVENIDDLTAEEVSENLLTTGSSLGQSFFNQVLVALLVAFVLMGIVVFIKFKVPVPSFAVILAAFSDIVVTLAVVNLLGMKLSTAGIAAFLMLIGYSVDTDILLSTRVLKRTSGTVYQRVISALKTGVTMNLTTLVAITVALVVSKSSTITEIMTILFIGLIVDMINTWIQNAGILRWYAEKQLQKSRGGK